MKQLPANGLVCFFGETLDHGFVSVSLTPPLPVIMGDYACGSTFRTSMWEALNASYPTVGLVVLNGSKALLGISKGPHLFPIKTMTWMMSSSTRRGGQSAPRISRLHKESEANWVKEVEEGMATHIFPLLEDSRGHHPKHWCLLGGPADMKILLAERLGLPPDHTLTTSSVDLEALLPSAQEWVETKKVKEIHTTLKTLTSTLELRPDYLAVGGREVKAQVLAGRVDQVFSLDDFSPSKLDTIRRACDAFGTYLHLIPFHLAPPILQEARLVGILRYLSG